MGRAFGIECKFGRNKSSPIQTHQQDIMVGAGARIFEVSERNFDEFIVRHRTGTLTLALGENGAATTFTLRIFVDRRRACNQRVWWCCHDLYRVLNLTTYNKQPSK